LDKHTIVLIDDILIYSSFFLFRAWTTLKSCVANLKRSLVVCETEQVWVFVEWGGLFKTCNFSKWYLYGSKKGRSYIELGETNECNIDLVFS